MTIDTIAAFSAFIVGVIAMVLAIRKQHTTGLPTQSALLTNSELRDKINDLQRDVASLQRMLVEKQNEIDQLNERIRQLERGAVFTNPDNQETKRKVLLVCIGTDTMLETDNAMLRKVQAQTNIRITRLLPVRKDSLKRLLDRNRLGGHPIEYVHFGVHASHEGLVFEDGIATGVWLSEQLSGVKIVVLAGCQTDYVADLMGVVDSVVSLRENVNNQDAAQFSTAFWMTIGRGAAPEEAFERALVAAPSVAEFAELHN